MYYLCQICRNAIVSSVMWIQWKYTMSEGDYDVVISTTADTQAQ